jgi:hypothetical protein
MDARDKARIEANLAAKGIKPVAPKKAKKRAKKDTVAEQAVEE